MPLTFCLLNPHFFKVLKDNLFTFLAFIFPLQLFSNFEKTELAAAN